MSPRDSLAKFASQLVPRNLQKETEKTQNNQQNIVDFFKIPLEWIMELLYNTNKYIDFGDFGAEAHAHGSTPQPRASLSVARFPWVSLGIS